MMCFRGVRPAVADAGPVLGLPGRPDHRLRGMVTFELAIGMLAACLLAAMLGWSINLVVLRARCQDSAVQIARQLARDDEAAASEAIELAPPGAAIGSEYGPRGVKVTVTVRASWGRLGPVEVTASAVFPREGRPR